MAKKRAGKEELEAVLNNHTASAIVDFNGSTPQARIFSEKFERADGLVVKIKNYAGRVLARSKSIFKNGSVRSVPAGTKWEDIPAEFKRGGAYALQFSDADFQPAAKEE